MDEFTFNLLVFFILLGLAAAAMTIFAFVLNGKAHKRDREAADKLQTGLRTVRQKLGL